MGGREVHLNFMWDSQNPSHNNYDYILLFDKSGQLLDEDRPSPSIQQIMMPLYDYKVTDLTDESDTTPMQQHDYFPYTKNDVQFPSHLFIKIAPKWVDYLPDDIGGMKIYNIKCLHREWVKKTGELRYFKMHSSWRKGLIGMRKIGRCIGNLYYPYDECPFKLSADRENTSNI